MSKSKILAALVATFGNRHYDDIIKDENGNEKIDCHCTK